IDLSLPSVATGRVDRVWYSQDGSILYAQTSAGRIFQTADFEQWTRVEDPKIAPPNRENPPIVSSPETRLKSSAPTGLAARVYAIGHSVYRSDDDGSSWSNLTSYKGVSILGDGFADVASSPRDSDDVVVASATGVWHSVDGGMSWSGVNDFLPNLPGSHI